MIWRNFQEFSEILISHVPESQRLTSLGILKPRLSFLSDGMKGGLSAIGSPDFTREVRNTDIYIKIS